MKSLNPTEIYIDNSINGQSHDSMNLSIQLSLNEVSFSITHDKQDNYLAIVSYNLVENSLPSFLAEFLNYLFEKEVLLKHKFSKVIVSYRNNLTTLIPSELYDDKQRTAYIDLFKPDLNTSSVKSDFIKEIDAYNLYLLPHSIEKIIKDKFFEAKIIHHSTNLIKGAFNAQSLLGSPKRILINICNNEFDLIIISNAKLQVVNTFQFKVKEDFLYYLLFTMKQFKCNPVDTELILMGKIIDQSAIHQLLIKYIAEVRFYKDTTLSNLNTILKEVPDHYYFTLQNLSKCV